MQTAITTLSRSVPSASRTYFNWQFLVFWAVYLTTILTLIYLAITHTF